MVIPYNDPIVNEPIGNNIMKIRKGLTLTLRTDLVEGGVYGNVKWFSDMKKGKVKVKSFDPLSGVIKLQDDFQGNCYSKEMFEELK